MFKFVVLSALFALAMARPGLYESVELHSAPLATVTVQEHGYAHTGSLVKSVPSAVSHQSHSVVHSSAHVVEDVLAPAVKTTSYTTKTLATPVVETYSAPALVKTVSTPVLQTYESAPVLVKSW
uniref:Cuticle protein n=1 Tax=Musca domestica TaxID=7370 RepID=A0A1I8NHE8_MUSDO